MTDDESLERKNLLFFNYLKGKGTIFERQNKIKLRKLHQKRKRKKINKKNDSEKLNFEKN